MEFRSLPIARSAVLAGRALSDLATQVLGLLVLAGTGLAVGWRIHNGIGDALLALGLSLLFAFAMTWAGACAGMLLRSPERRRSGSSSSCRCRSCPARSCHPGHAWLAARFR